MSKDEDLRLFREAMRDVKPLAAQQPAVRPPRSRSRRRRADRPQGLLPQSLELEAADPAPAGADELSFQRPGISAGVLRKLRRGQYRVQSEIDLHGLTAIEARRCLTEFLLEACERRWRCVRVVHGKGLGSGHRGPVLKGVVAALLRRTDAVLAYVSARQADGGTGAVHVLLSASS